MRLFAALPLCVSAVERLARFRLRTSAPRDGLRWSGPEQWHVTMQFYGEVSPEQTERLAAALEGSSLHPATLEITSLGVFAAKGILFAAIYNSEPLQLLQRQVRAASETCGMLPETRPFQPHITLARRKNHAGARTLQQLATPELPTIGSTLRWCPAELHLLASELSPGGAQYTVVRRVRLATEPQES